LYHLCILKIADHSTDLSKTLAEFEKLKLYKI